jgi:hypothetical protein
VEWLSMNMVVAERRAGARDVLMAVLSDRLGGGAELRRRPVCSATRSQRLDRDNVLSNPSTPVG